MIYDIHREKDPSFIHLCHSGAELDAWMRAHPGDCFDATIDMLPTEQTGERNRLAEEYLKYAHQLAPKCHTCQTPIPAWIGVRPDGGVCQNCCNNEEAPK